MNTLLSDISLLIHIYIHFIAQNICTIYIIVSDGQAMHLHWVNELVAVASLVFLL